MTPQIGSMIKAIGCFLVLAAGGAGALLCVHRERRRLSVLDAWIELIRSVRTKIDCFLMPQNAILAALEERVVIDCGGTYPCRSFAQLAQAAKPYLPPDGNRTVAAFASGIGTGYREEQVRACDYYVETLRRIREQTAEGLSSRLRVRVALCLSAALGATILLW